jgi:hypothetical protein
MKKLTNYTPGPRGVTTKKDGVVWLKPGESAEFDPADIITTPDLGDKPKVERDAEDEALAALMTENAALKAKVTELTAALEKAAKPAGK